MVAKGMELARCTLKRLRKHVALIPVSAPEGTIHPSTQKRRSISTFTDVGAKLTQHVRELRRSSCAAPDHHFPLTKAYSLTGCHRSSALASSCDAPWPGHCVDATPPRGGMSADSDGFSCKLRGNVRERHRDIWKGGACSMRTPYAITKRLLVAPSSQGLAMRCCLGLSAIIRIVPISPLAAFDPLDWRLMSACMRSETSMSAGQDRQLTDGCLASAKVSEL